MKRTRAEEGYQQPSGKRPATAPRAAPQPAPSGKLTTQDALSYLREVSAVEWNEHPSQRACAVRCGMEVFLAWAATHSDQPCLALLLGCGGSAHCEAKCFPCQPLKTGDWVTHMCARAPACVCAQPCLDGAQYTSGQDGVGVPVACMCTVCKSSCGLLQRFFAMRSPPAPPPGLHCVCPCTVIFVCSPGCVRAQSCLMKPW